MTVSSSMRAPSIGLIFLFREHLVSTARSVVDITRPCAGSLANCSRPNRPIMSTTSISSGCGTGKREYVDQRVDDLLGVVARGARVPQAPAA